MVIKNKNNEFIYNTFFRSNPPSILRLAFIQLNREGVKFTKKEDLEKSWNLLWDRAGYIVKILNKNKEVKELHVRLINERTY